MDSRPNEENADLIIKLKGLMKAITFRSFRDWAQHIRAMGLSMPQFGVLMRLYHGAGCSVSDIAAHMDVTNASASQLVDRLVNQGIVERREDPEDRRARDLSLTPRGRTLVEGCLKERLHWVEEMIQSLDQEKLSAIRAALPALTEAMQKYPEAHGGHDPHCRHDRHGRNNRGNPDARASHGERGESC